ncbi:MAG TPA: C45 family peptidase [Myxococcota bacterium]
MATFPHVRVAGRPRERGRQYGEQTRERVARSIAAYGAVFQHYAGWSWSKVTREALRYEEPIAAYGAAYLEELRGIAEGAGVGFEDVLAINTRTEVMFAARARDAARVSARAAGECSAFCVLPEASADGHTWIGQNWDWLLHCTDTVVVLEVEQEEGPDFVTVVEAGLLAKTGFNSSGIGLATNTLVTDADAGKPAVPYHVVLRAILDCENLSDALAALQRSPRSSSANYLVAHRDGIAVDAEAAPGDFSQLHLSFPAQGTLVHTNHFLSPAFCQKDVSLWLMPDSPLRLERVRASVAAAAPRLSARDLQAMLADHANYPSAVCAHPDPRDPLQEQAATIASVLMDLDARRMWLADGQPCQAAYRELDYAAFLAKPSPLRARA